MPNNKRRSSSSSLFRNVSVHLKHFLFLAKLKKPIVPMLLSLNKTRRLKKFNNSSFYVKEYEFSPSATPLIHPFRRGNRLTVKIKGAHLGISRCLGDDEDRSDGIRRGMLDCSFPGRPNRNLIGGDYCDHEDDDCVDVRAERFIQRFYQDMTRQSLESHLNSIPTS